MRARLPVSGHARQHEPRVALAEHVVTQTPLLQRAGPETLDHHVGGLDQLQEQLLPAWVAQVEGDAALVAGMDGPEEVVTVQLGLAPVPQRVRPVGCLDLDHVGAMICQQPSAERAGDEGPELQDPDAVEGGRGDRIIGHPLTLGTPGRPRYPVTANEYPSTAL